MFTRLRKHDSNLPRGKLQNGGGHVCAGSNPAWLSFFNMLVVMPRGHNRNGISKAKSLSFSCKKSRGVGVGPYWLKFHAIE